MPGLERQGRFPRDRGCDNGNAKKRSGSCTDKELKQFRCSLQDSEQTSGAWSLNGALTSAFSNPVEKHDVMEFITVAGKNEQFRRVF